MQTGGLLKDLTVAETARYTASLFAHTQSVKEVLTRAGIAAIADRKVGKCSGGTPRRAAPCSQTSHLPPAGTLLPDATRSPASRRYIQPQ
jgi:ABC-type multidrug transport system ATPase subunit